MTHPAYRGYMALADYERMPWADKLSLYDSHNGDSRSSPVLNERLFGKCGCQFCGMTRARWANNPAPINDQTRIGSNSMSSVNLCDRCGAMVTGAALASLNLRTSADYDTSETVTKELCPGCVALIIALVEDDNVQPLHRSYRKPWVRPEDPANDPVRKVIRDVLEEALNAHRAIEAEAKETDKRDAETTA